MPRLGRKEMNIISAPPCSDIERESIGIRACCVLLSKIYQRKNTKQIMELMKYSLDQSAPLVSQYYGSTNDQDMIIDRNKQRHMTKLWLHENKESVLKIFPNNTDFSFLKDFGYVLINFLFKFHFYIIKMHNSLLGSLLL